VILSGRSEAGSFLSLLSERLYPGLSGLQVSPDILTGGFMKKTMTVIPAFAVGMALILASCANGLTSNAANGNSSAARTVCSGGNGTIAATGMTNTSLTVSYAPGSRKNYARLYVSRGNGTGLVLANQNMNYSGGTYSYTLSNSSFTSGAAIYLCVLINDAGTEKCIPQGALSDTTSWTKIAYGSDTADSGSSTDDPIPSADGTYTLAWSDEFNGTSLNLSNWVYETGTGAGGWGNNELEYYTNRTDNVSVSGGNLIITARRENYNGAGYTSGRIKTQGLKTFKYGKIEARIKLPSGQGLWPAFWMLGAEGMPIKWPECGEIDIMEHVNSDPDVVGTAHWDNNGHASWGCTTRDNYWNNFSVDVTQFHVYAVEWSATAIKWYVDGTQYMECDITNGKGGTEEFQKNFFILLNLAVGGNWPGNPDNATPFPSSMYVDYVRVYQ
jgi:beta-glucanase (GH16 family)